MSTREKLIKARLGMLALAEQLSSVSLACKRAGICRSHFYEIKEAFEKYGAEGFGAAAASQSEDAQSDGAGAGGEDPRDDRAVSCDELSETLFPAQAPQVRSLHPQPAIDQSAKLGLQNSVRALRTT